MKINGFSFHSDNVKLASEIYSELFGWEILVSKPNHSELLISEGQEFILYVSPLGGKCPTDPGTLILTMNDDEFEYLTQSPLWIKNFQQEYSDAGFNYSSWLDPWGNRIWLYYDTLNI